MCIRDRNRLYLNAVGERRFTILELIEEKSYLEALVEQHTGDNFQEIAAESRYEAQKAASRHLKSIVDLNGGWVRNAETPIPDEPEKLSFFLGQLLQASNKIRQEILEESSPTKRIELCFDPTGYRAFSNKCISATGSYRVSCSTD